jgi:hypothetical protein
LVLSLTEASPHQLSSFVYGELGGIGKLRWFDPEVEEGASAYATMSGTCSKEDMRAKERTSSVEFLFALHDFTSQYIHHALRGWLCPIRSSGGRHSETAIVDLGKTF